MCGRSAVWRRCLASIFRFFYKFRKAFGQFCEPLPKTTHRTTTQFSYLRTLIHTCRRWLFFNLCSCFRAFKPIFLHFISQHSQCSINWRPFFSLFRPFTRLLTGKGLVLFDVKLEHVHQLFIYLIIFLLNHLQIRISLLIKERLVFPVMIWNSLLIPAKVFLRHDWEGFLRALKPLKTVVSNAERFTEVGLRICVLRSQRSQRLWPSLFNKTSISQSLLQVGMTAHISLVKEVFAWGNPISFFLVSILGLQMLSKPIVVLCHATKCGQTWSLITSRSINGHQLFRNETRSFGRSHRSQPSLFFLLSARDYYLHGAPLL